MYIQSAVILSQVCAAAKKKSLSGLDNIAAKGSEGFDVMDGLIGLLGECGEFSTVLIQQLHFSPVCQKSLLNQD